MGFLEAEGFESLKRKAQRYVRDAVNEIKAHITEELERIVAPLNDSIAALQAALDKDDADDAVIIAARDKAIADLEAERAAGAQNAADLATANQAIDDATTRLGLDDLPEPEPTPEPPAGETSPA